MEQSDEISRITAERDDYKSRWEAAHRRADRAEARLAHAESEYVRMGDELAEVVHRSCERQMALEAALSALSRIKSVARNPTMNERLAACWKIASETDGGESDFHHYVIKRGDSTWCLAQPVPAPISKERNDETL